MRIVEGFAIGLLLIVPVVAFACGGSDNGGPAADAGPDVAAETEPPPAVDGGPDVEQPPDKYPANHAAIPQLDDLGGPVLDHVKIVTVTFFHATVDGGTDDAGSDGGDGGNGGVPDQWRESLRSFDDFITTSDWWHQTMAGYKVSDGSGGLYGELDDSKVANKAITDLDIQQMLQDGITSGALPPPQDQILYAMYFPTSTQISNSTQASCTDFLGYHFEMSILLAGKTSQVAYAVLPRCSASTPAATKDQLTVTASHEFAEAASDPYPGTNATYRLVTNDAWIPALGGGTAGDENGDVCIFAPNYDESGWKVQPIWSNAAAAASHDPCEPLGPTASQIYYGAAVRTDKLKIGGRDVLGYVTVSPGKSTTVLVDFFSTDKLPQDAKLFVGRDKGTADPTDMREIADGITATLSRAEAHNGNGMTLTLSAPANAVRGDYRFAVRSVLDSSDFHDWPVIAHVQ